MMSPPRGFPTAGAHPPNPPPKLVPASEAITMAMAGTSRSAVSGNNKQPQSHSPAVGLWHQDANEGT